MRRNRPGAPEDRIRIQHMMDAARQASSAHAVVAPELDVTQQFRRPGLMTGVFAFCA